MQINSLANKVSALRDISKQIGNAVREDNALLGDLEGGFDSANSLLGGTMQRLSSLASSKDSRHMLYLACFVVFIFLLMYKLSH